MPSGPERAASSTASSDASAPASNAPLAWSPARVLRWLSPSFRWTVAIRGKRLALTREGRTRHVVLDDRSPLRIERRALFVRLRLEVADESVVVGRARAETAREIAGAIERVLERRRAARARLDAALARRRARERTAARAEDDLRALMRWYRGTTGLGRDADEQDVWMPIGEVRQLDRARPATLPDPGQLASLLERPDVLARLGDGVAPDDVRTAYALCRDGLEAHARDHNRRCTAAEIDWLERHVVTEGGRPLTPDQATAAVCPDPRVLVVASAGSGKTSTMVAKAAYEIRRGAVSPNGILMLAFNKKAAGELRERMARALAANGIDGARVTASTFHALGKHVLLASGSGATAVADWLGEESSARVLQAVIDELGRDDPSFARSWRRFCAVSLLGQSYRAAEHPTGADPLRTLLGERVRHVDEVGIANWLFLHGARYRYADGAFRYDELELVHVHRVHEEEGASSVPGDGRRDADPDVFETDTAGLRDGSAFERLHARFAAHGIALEPNVERERRLDAAAKPHDLLKLLRSFTDRVKDADVDDGTLRERLARERVGGLRQRHELLLELAMEVRRAWDARLARERAIDFNDMLVGGARQIERGAWRSPYELIMVDEFQDVSESRVRMVLALLQRPGSRLFAVGDDWQAINRFAGSDIRYMSGFGEAFGEGERVDLERTFRFPQSLCDVSRRFVLANPRQLDKRVLSAREEHERTIRLYCVPDEAARRDRIDHYLEKLHDECIARDPTATTPAKVLVLGRYHNDRDCLNPAVVERLEPVLSIEFETVHKSKGDEADYVVLPAMTGGGFPSTREDDPVMRVVLPPRDAYPYADERRLFYVALTRAKRNVALFTIEGRVSPFVEELLESENDLELVSLSARSPAT